MSSRRQRSYSRDRGHSRSQSRDRDRSRSRSPERRVELPSGASHISESDYFLKSDEFRIWLKEDKGKYLDELSSDRSRKYFRKFVKAWNRGKLPKSLYAGVDAAPASSQTAYRWSFASKTSGADSAAIRATREEVDQATYGRSGAHHASNGPSRRIQGPVQGPSLPNASDLTLAREAAEEDRATIRTYKRRKDRREREERLEETVGPKPVGREGMLEKKRARREDDRAFRERRDDAGLEVDEGSLMGGGDSFKERIAKRDAARKRFEEKRHGPREERDAAARERADALRQKDKATMEMFMQMAKDKFG